MCKKMVIVVCMIILLSIIVIAENEKETWSIETVDSTGDVGMFTSIVLDSNGYPHISYLDITNEDLKYAKWTGSVWSIDTVDSAGDVGYGNSIELDSNGYPHISYSDNTNEDIKYAKWTGSAWSIETVDSGIGRTSIALDSNGYPHICYSYTVSLEYAKWTGSAWSIETVKYYTYISPMSIALDSNGYPHISYEIRTAPGLRYAKWTGSTWSFETVDSDSSTSSMALDNNGYPHICYLDSTNCDLKYAKWTGSAWSIETVDSSGNVGIYMSIALDSNGYPHISYSDNTNEDFKYAKWTGSAWSIETVDSAGNVGGSTSIALDSNGYPHISYRDYTNHDLKYAKLMPTAPSTPTPPRYLQAIPGDKFVDLRWDAPSGDGGSAITEYKIYRDTSSGGETYLASVSASTTSYEDKTVNNGQTYYYHVTAVNVAGESISSNEVHAKPQGTSSPPRNLQATAGDGYVTLEWNVPSNNGGSLIENYLVYRGTTSGGERLLETIGIFLDYQDTLVEAGQTYYYKISAVNSAGEGEKSNEVSVMLATPTISPTLTSTITPTPTSTITPTITPTSTPNDTAAPGEEGITQPPENQELLKLIAVVLVISGLFLTSLTSIKKDVSIEFGVSEKSLKYVGGAGILLIIIGVYMLLKCYSLI